MLTTFLGEPTLVNQTLMYNAIPLLLFLLLKQQLHLCTRTSMLGICGIITFKNFCFKPWENFFDSIHHVNCHLVIQKF